MIEDEEASVHCPRCRAEMATITVEVRSKSARVARYLIDELTPISDGLMLPFCDDCQEAAAATTASERDRA